MGFIINKESDGNNYSPMMIEELRGLIKINLGDWNTKRKFDYVVQGHCYRAKINVWQNIYSTVVRCP